MLDNPSLVVLGALLTGMRNGVAFSAIHRDRGAALLGYAAWSTVGAITLK